MMRRKRVRIVLLALILLMIVGMIAGFWRYLPAVNNGDDVTVEVAGLTNDNGKMRVVLGITNNGPSEVQIRSGVFLHSKSAGDIGMSCEAIYIPPGGDARITTFPGEMAEGPCYLRVFWIEAWASRVFEWSERARIIPVRSLGFLPRYRMTETAEYTP